MAARGGSYPRHLPCKRSLLGFFSHVDDRRNKLGGCRGISPAPHSQILPVRPKTCLIAGVRQGASRHGDVVVSESGMGSGKLWGDLSS